MLALFFGSIFVSNIVFANFLGICPYIGVSKKTSTAFGMGGAVTFVMLISSIVTFLINNYLLDPFGISYLKTIVFILVIASLVQLVEIILRKLSPTLFKALGVYLALITTNCAIFGVALLNIQNGYSFFQMLVFSLGNAIGFVLAIVLFASIRERLNYVSVPSAFHGVPIALVVASILSMAFMGFSGVI